jgi:hypothetical protein
MRGGKPLEPEKDTAPPWERGPSRREAAWSTKALRDEALPLFAAADDRDAVLRPEAVEPAVTLTPMTTGREVVEDYRSKGLSLRAHPPEPQVIAPLQSCAEMLRLDRSAIGSKGRPQ